MGATLSRCTQSLRLNCHWGGGVLVNDLNVDLDGVADNVDNCPSVTNSDQRDTDSDGSGDACDPDKDGDGVRDDDDAFPLDAAESLDTDGDGVGNNADPDDDGDGVRE